MSIKFKKLNNTIIKCKKCPRLFNFIKKISLEKRKQNINEKYWGKPVTGFGDVNAKLMIIGLAPAAHGGTRTGRAFTGDKSGDFLFKSLHKVNISNQDFSKNRNDGLRLKSTYITNILKCVPPGDKPKNTELIKCSNYFISELDQLKKVPISFSSYENDFIIAFTSGEVVRINKQGKVIWLFKNEDLLNTPVKIYDDYLIISYPEKIIFLSNESLSESLLLGSIILQNGDISVPFLLKFS